MMAPPIIWHHMMQYDGSTFCGHFGTCAKLIWFEKHNADLFNLLDSTLNCFLVVMTGLLIFSICFIQQWVGYSCPSSPATSFSQLLTVQEVAQSPFGTFSKNRSPYPRLALPQGFGPSSRLWPSSRLSIFSSIAFSGYFNPATLFLFHLQGSLWLRPSFILRPGTFWTAPCLCLVVGKGWTAHCWSCWCCCFAGSALSQGLLFALFQGLCLPFPKAFCLPFPKATPLIPGRSWQRNMGSIPDNWKKVQWENQIVLQHLVHLPGLHLPKKVWTEWALHKKKVWSMNWTVHTLMARPLGFGGWDAAAWLAPYP